MSKPIPVWKGIAIMVGTVIFIIPVELRHNLSSES